MHPHQCRSDPLDDHAVQPRKTARTWKMVFYMLAVGVRPENVFIQSLVPEHAEAAWSSAA